MKVLKGTQAWIEGKLYKEGQSIPQKYEKEFENFLVEAPAPAKEKASDDKTKQESKTKPA
jgi:hypothetical protein